MDSSVLFLTVILVIIHLLKEATSQRVPDTAFSRGCLASRGQFPHETFCHQYYNCWDGRATVEQCPGELLFNPSTSTCDYPEAVLCGGRIRNPAPFISAGRCLKEWGTFADPTDCRAFYECDHGKAFHKYCPFYTGFDEKTLVCVHASEVECGGRGGVYGTLSPSLFPALGDPAGAGSSRSMSVGSAGSGKGSGGYLKGSPAGLGSNSIGRESQFERPLTSESSFRCPHPRGLYSYSSDCTHFWLCREYRPSLLKCPSGQLFDAASLTCTLPEKAQCSTSSRL